MKTDQTMNALLRRKEIPNSNTIEGRIFEAIYNNDIDTFTKILNENVLSGMDQGVITKDKIRNKIDFSCQNKHGYTFLIQAVINNCHPIIKILLPHYSNQNTNRKSTKNSLINVMDDKGWSALMQAASSDNIAVVKMLIKHNVAIINESGFGKQGTFTNIEKCIFTYY